MAAAGRQGLTEMQLMSAAVDACAPADVAAPVALDAAAARLKLLVSLVVQRSVQHSPATAPCVHASENAVQSSMTAAAALLVGGLQQHWLLLVCVCGCAIRTRLFGVAIA